MTRQLNLLEQPEQPEQPVIGLGGKPAGPRQRALLELLDAGRPVSEETLLEAALDDMGCPGTRQVHTRKPVKELPPPPPVPRPDPAAVAEAYRRSDEQFRRWWRKRQEDFPG